jgi:hypothetical protein
MLLGIIALLASATLVGVVQVRRAQWRAGLTRIYTYEKGHMGPIYRPEPYRLVDEICVDMGQAFVRGGGPNRNWGANYSGGGVVRFSDGSEVTCSALALSGEGEAQLRPDGILELPSDGGKNRAFVGPGRESAPSSPLDALIGGRAR